MESANRDDEKKATACVERLRLFEGAAIETTRVSSGLALVERGVIGGAGDWGKPGAGVVATLDRLKSGLVVFDNCLRTVHTNRKFRQMLDIAGDVAEGTRLNELVNPDTIAGNVVAAIEAHCARACAARDTGRTQAFLVQGEARAFTMEICRVGERLWLAAFEDLGERQEAEQKILEFALRDPLTGLANRNFFERCVDRALRDIQKTPFALLFMDLDRFKAVNDAMGHETGDQLLRLVGHRLLTALGNRMVVARFGGDEFAVLLKGATTTEEAESAARRIADMVEKPYLVAGQPLHVGVSIGIARAPRDGETHGELFKCADLALYYSKEPGRGSVHFFEPHMEKRIHSRHSLEKDLRKALPLGQFELHYQPQVSLMTGRVEGFEALIRWRHPQHGLVPPDQFIPLAEEIGLIVPLGNWVLRTACLEAKRWGGELTMAVNASPLQFDHGTLAEAAARALRSAGLPPGQLEIEITEGLLAKKGAPFREQLSLLKEMGIRVAMDDFGTGFASLSHLASFPFDKIKIDRSLLNADAGDVKHRAIIRAVVTLGGSLGMSVLAEGVERTEQLATLREDGCFAVQGFVFSRPVPAREAEKLAAQTFSA